MFMLWYSDEPKPLAERVSRAADYYQAKYKKIPTRCLVPSGETEIPTMAGLICARDQYVLENHLMLGGDG
jgi:hypothetical protein